MVITAKFSQKCPGCGQTIAAGDKCEWEKGSKATCLDCAGAPAAVALAAEPVREWSPRQQAVFDAVLDDEAGNLIVMAVAGSGKTTTMVEAMRRYTAAYPGRAVTMVAFNRRIADELQERLRKLNSTASASTFHSAWLSAFTAHLGRRPEIDKDGKKVRQLARDLVRAGEIDRRTADDYMSGALQLVVKAKGAGIGVPGLLPDEIESWVALQERFEIVFDGPSDLDGIALARKLLAANNLDLSWVDFDDMLYLSALFGVQCTQYDFLSIDEAQDFNAVQRLLVHRMLKPNGRLLAIGDPRQSIYAFRGADCDSMDQIADEFHCNELALDISYRCPQNVVQLAQSVVSHIQSAPTAPLGTVATLSTWNLQDFRPMDAVLCRNTAPLITLAYKCLGARVNCRVLGREIGEGLIALIRKMKALDIEDLNERLSDYCRAETARFIARMEESKAAALQDKVDSIHIAISNLTGERTIDALCRDIEDLFAKQAAGVLTLCTVHKAKGDEWERVFVLNRFLMPSKHAKTDEQIEQEHNIEYVAYTRAKSELYFIDTSGLQ